MGLRHDDRVHLWQKTTGVAVRSMYDYRRADRASCRSYHPFLRRRSKRGRLNGCDWCMSVQLKTVSNTGPKHVRDYLVSANIGLIRLERHNASERSVPEAQDRN